MVEIDDRNDWTPEEFGFQMIRGKKSDIFAEGNIWQKGRYRLTSLGYKIFLCTRKVHKHGNISYLVRFRFVLDKYWIAKASLVYGLRNGTN